MTEQLYFVDTAVRITNTEATFGQRSYAISDINFVRYKVDPASKTGWWNILTKASVVTNGFGLIIFAGKIVLDVMNHPGTELSSILGPVSALIIGVSLLLLAVRQSFVRVRYLVSISGSFGEVDVVVARNEVYAQTVTKALNKALKHKRKTNQAQLRTT